MTNRPTCANGSMPTWTAICHAMRRAAFHEHLRRCAACSEALDEQRWIDGLLTSAVAIDIETAPTRAQLPLRRPRRRAWLSLAAAAALAGLACWPLRSHLRSAAPGAGPPASDSPLTLSAKSGVVRPSPASPLPADDVPAGTFVSTGAAVALTVASPSADVTVVQLYPTLPPARPPRHGSTVAFYHPSPHGG